MSPYCSEQVGADDRAVLDQIIDSLTSLANPKENNGLQSRKGNEISLKVGKVQESGLKKEPETKSTSAVLILGAGRVCQPAAELLASVGSISSRKWLKICLENDFEGRIQVLVASLFLRDAEEV